MDFEEFRGNNLAERLTPPTKSIELTVSKAIEKMNQNPCERCGHRSTRLLPKEGGKYCTTCYDALDEKKE